MWTEIKTAANLMLAEMWKEFFEGEGIPTQIMAVAGVTPAGQSPGRELAVYRILVPNDKKHLIQEVLRSL